MPGHSTAWFVGYPDLASAPGPYTIERKWGVFDPAMDPTRESTYKFLDEFIGEMAKLFPDQFFHIGGDEVNGKQWDANPKIQEFMHAHNLKNNADLQAYFNTRIQKIVAKHGKTMEGWDEILRPDLPKTIVIQSWRGQQSLADAAQTGISWAAFVGLLSRSDGFSGLALRSGPFADGAANLSDEDKQKILGGEACMWAEYVSPENIDSRIWPRMAAIAERLWSPQNVTDVNSMYCAHGLHKPVAGCLWPETSNKLPSHVGAHDQREGRDGAENLADVVEPVKGYAREQLAKTEPTAQTPLNRVIDAARPESATARQFGELVDEFLSGKNQAGNGNANPRQLTKWKDNQVALAPEEQELGIGAGSCCRCRRIYRRWELRDCRHSTTLIVEKRRRTLGRRSSFRSPNLRST